MCWLLHLLCCPSLCVLNPNELRLSSLLSPEFYYFPPFNLRVLINGGKVMCQVCFACGFLRLKAAGNSSSVRRASAALRSPEGGLQLCWLKKTSALDSELLDIDPSFTVELWTCCPRSGELGSGFACSILHPPFSVSVEPKPANVNFIL